MATEAEDKGSFLDSTHQTFRTEHDVIPETPMFLSHFLPSLTNERENKENSSTTQQGLSTEHETPQVIIKFNIKFADNLTEHGFEVSTTDIQPLNIEPALFWNYVEKDRVLEQRMVNLWLNTSQDIAGKVQSNRATEPEKAAVLQFFTTLNIVETEVPNQLQDLSTEGSVTEHLQEELKRVLHSERVESTVPEEKFIPFIPVSGHLVDETSLLMDGVLLQEGAHSANVDFQEEEDDDDYDPGGDFNSVEDVSVQDVDSSSLSITGSNDAVAILNDIEQGFNERLYNEAEKDVEGRKAGGDKDAVEKDATEMDAELKDTVDGVNCHDHTYYTTSSAKLQPSLPRTKYKPRKSKTDLPPPPKIIPGALVDGKIFCRCKICGERFDDDGKLQQHVDTMHLGFKKHVCGLCHNRFQLPSGLKRHMKTHHNEIKSVTPYRYCQKCGKRFKFNHICEKPRIKRKYEGKTMDQKLKAKYSRTKWCGICKQLFLSPDKLRAHVKTVHEKCDSHSCVVCGKRFSLPSLVKQHAKVHEDNDVVKEPSVVATSGKTRNPKRVRYQCDKCMKFYKNGASFEKHVCQEIRKIQFPKQWRYQCDKCMKVYKNGASFEKHVCRELTFPFRCKLCGHKSKTEASLKSHEMEIHLKKPQFKCTLCTSIYRRKTDLTRHYKLYHEKVQQCSCEFCGKIFISKTHRKSHMFAKHRSAADGEMKQKAVQCETCGKIFRTEEILKTHKATHDPNREMFKCDQCEKMFGLKSGLKAHIERIHENSRQKTVLCATCGKCFYNTRTMECHVRMVHEKVRPHTCPECDKKFATVSNLKNHIRTHQRRKEVKAKKPRPGVPCNMCGRVFKSQSLLAIHMVTHNPERNFKCDLCQQTFKLASSLQSHNMKVHLKIRRHKCEVCHKGFSERTGLKQHMERMHSKDGVNRHRFPCPLCEKTLHNERAFKIHTDWHNGLVQLTCKTCGKECTTEQSLRTHVRTHSNDAYRCKECGKRFRTREQLDAHRMKDHYGITDWKRCTTCDKEFTTRVSLLRHMKNHRGESWDCQMCGEKFRTLYGREKHKKNECLGKTTQDLIVIYH